MKRSIVFDEPVFYVSLALIVLSLGCWLAFLSGSTVPLLMTGVPLGWMLHRVAGGEIIEGKRWIVLAIGLFILLGVAGIAKNWRFVTQTSIFAIIVVGCSLYDWKITYKKKAIK